MKKAEFWILGFWLVTPWNMVQWKHSVIIINNYIDIDWHEVASDTKAGVKCNELCDDVNVFSSNWKAQIPHS